MLIRLRELRKERGLSQQQLAARLGISQQSVNKYENHNVEPDIAMLSQMADLFSTTVDYLIGRSNDRIPHGLGVPAELTMREAAVLAAYRQLTPEQALVVDLLLRSYLPNRE